MKTTLAKSPVPTPVNVRRGPSLLRMVSGAILRHGVLIGASFVMLYPLLWMLASSFKPESIIFTDLSIIPPSFDFANYTLGWNALQQSFAVFFKNSLFVAILVVIGNVLSCSITAYAFARLEFRGRRFWFVVMVGTLRTFDDAMRADISERIKRTAENIAESAGATAIVRVDRGGLVQANDTSLTERMMPTLKRTAGFGGLQLINPIMGSEDFPVFAKSGCRPFCRLPQVSNSSLQPLLMHCHSP